MAAAGRRGHGKAAESLRRASKRCFGVGIGEDFSEFLSNPLPVRV